MKKNYTLNSILFVLITFISLYPASLNAQAPQIEWAQCYGGSANDQAKDIYRTADSGYVVCGFTASNDSDITDNHGAMDAWIIKLSVSGEIIWQKTYGGSADDAFNAILQLADGGYVACGYTASSDGDVDSLLGEKDFWIVRTNALGNIIWEETYGGSKVDVAHDVASSGDTAFVIVGYTFSDDGWVSNYKDNGDGWVLYLDASGGFVLQKDKGGSEYDEFKSVVTAENGGYMLVGTSFSNNGTVDSLNHGGSDAWLARLSKYGTDQWNMLFGDTLNDGAFDVHEDELNRFIATGYRDYGTQNESWIFTVDSLGAFVSESVHGGIADELPGSSLEKTVSSYIVAGSSNSPPSGDKNCQYAGYDIWMYNTLIDGSIAWQKCMGGTGEDISSRTIISPDGSITVCGYTNSNDLDVTGNNGDNDFWVVRLLDGCDITANFSQTINGNNVTFTNLSFNALSFVWSFGDDSFSTDINPTHAFPGEGTYTVCLIASSLCASDTFCTEITIVCSEALASYSYSVSNLTATFTSLSENATQWQWDFGDGFTSDFENPVHDFDTAGTYEVCLIASNFCSSDTFCQTVTVECTPIVSSFTYQIDGLTVSFQATSPGAIEWKWRFGDGGNTNQENPVYTYADTGLYEVCMVAFNSCDNDTLCVEIYIGCVDAVAAFSYVQSGSSISFGDASLYASEWFWDFGDGSTSTDQNPDHVYAAEGTYTVCLTITNVCSSDTVCEDVVIQCTSAIASFTFDINGSQVTFTDQSDSATSWFWTFGDGNSSVAQNPIHNYTLSGTYNVCLIAGNSCAPDTFCQEVTILCAPVQSSFTYSVNVFEVTFTDQTNGATLWFWDFGDGGTSLQQNPVHTYSDTGTYVVCLVTFNDCSADTLCQEINVGCIQVQASFSFAITEFNVSFTDFSTDAAAWFWDFGDGATSSAQSPFHLYNDTGTYVVCLTAFNDCSTDSICTTIVISCPPFDAGFTFFQSGNIIQFTDESINSVSWNWSFGDGTTSTLQDPLHEYTANGIFEVCLITSDGCSSDSICDSLTVIGVSATMANATSHSLNVYPNPTGDDATVSFSISESSLVTITVNDVQGRILETLLNEHLPSGNHTLPFSKKDLPAGNYLLHMKSDKGIVVSRVVIE